MERILITKVKRTGPTQADLYGARHKFPDLKCFDLAELAAVGVDYEALQVGEETPARFWATYELSDKLNKAGNPYKDLVALERVDTPATTTSTDTGAIVAELRAIRALLQVLAEAQGLTVATPSEPEPEPDPDLDAAFPRFGDGSAVPDAALPYYHEHVKATGQAPASVDALRDWAKAHGHANGKGK